MNKFFDSVKKFFRSRNLKYGTNSMILIVAVIAIAVVVNILADMTGIKWDLTPNKLFSLSDETKTILNDLEKDVTIYGLFDEGKAEADNDYKEIISLLDQYAKYPNITVKYIDTDRNPGILNQLDPEKVKNIRMGDFVIQSGSKSKKYSIGELFQDQMNRQTFQVYRVGSKAEQVLTGAVKFVSSEKTPTVYFMDGHDELKVDTNYTKLRQYLEMNNYEVNTVNLMTQAKVPDDAEMVIVASPKKDLSLSEKDKLKEYLKNGGKGIFMFDSLEPSPVFAEFEDILKDYNISINYDKVKENDENRHVPDNPYDILPDIQTGGGIVPTNFVMIMPKSRSINILKNQKDYITVTSLMKTSGDAIGEQIDKSRGEDLNGPLDLAVASEYKGGKEVSKVLVIGNANFMTDGAIDQYGSYSANGAMFFLTSMSWMQDKKDDVIIAPKIYQNETLKLTANQAKAMGWLVTIVLPLIILGAGLFVYLRRRHL